MFHLLPLDFQKLVRIRLPCTYKNHQLTWVLSDSCDTDAAERLKQRVNDAAKHQGIKALDKEVYCILEEEPWKMERKRNLAQARAACEDLKPALSAFLKPDWPTGTLFLKQCGDGMSGDLRLGIWQRKTHAWEWFPRGLAALGVTHEQVQGAFAQQSS
jgi:hypothetical protein